LGKQGEEFLRVVIALKGPVYELLCSIVTLEGRDLAIL
jgi:hypothetical protein